MGAGATAAQAQGGGDTEENPDYRIRAEFDSFTGESVGNADFRVTSRFMQVYYGGVQRQDDFKFHVQLDSSNFADLSFDFFLSGPAIAGDYFLGTFLADSAGLVDVTYKNPWKPEDEPDLALPSDFPETISPGDQAKVRHHSTNALILSAFFEEEFARGDVNQDGEVDLLDFPFLEDNYGLTGVGPVFGDFTGDNKSNRDDYDVFVLNWTESFDPPAEPALLPEPATMGLLGMAGLGLLGKRRRVGAA
jgi:hypothetical protein